MVAIEKARQRGVERHVLLDVEKVRRIGNDFELAPGMRSWISLAFSGGVGGIIVADDDQRRHPDAGIGSRRSMSRIAAQQAA